MHHFHRLLRALGSHQGGSLRVGVCVDATSFGGFASDGDITTVKMSSDPALFHDSFERNETSSDDGQDNEENASAGVGTLGGWCPRIGEERRVVVVIEDHCHRHGRRRGGARHIVGHARHVMAHIHVHVHTDDQKEIR